MKKRTKSKRRGIPRSRAKNRLPALVRELLAEIGENPGREGLLNTPARVAEAWRYFTQGYNQDINDFLADAIFEAEHEGMVMVKDIEFYSLCEHHLVPFFGNCHIAYIPDRKIIGLSKLARIVDVYSRRLQVQERMTSQIAGAIEEHLQPRGVAVVLEARHLCMSMRGVEKGNSVVNTSVLRGEFLSDPSLRTAFFAQLGGAQP